MDNIDNKLNEEYVSGQNIFTGKVLGVSVDDVRLGDGRMAKREYIRHNGAVCIIPITDEGKVIMERQYRYPHHRVTLEIPAGKLDSRDEIPLEAAKRELSEETGATAGKITFLGMSIPSPAILEEKFYLYLAEDLTYGDTHPDDGEFLEQCEYDPEELYEMVMNDEIHDAKTQIAILKLHEILRRRREGK